MFVNSHVRRLKAAKGQFAVNELAERFGKLVQFRNLEEVSIKDEVAIIEICLDLMSENTIAPKDRAFETGKLHLQNFLGTPFGRIVVASQPITPNGFKKLFLNARHIARHIFKNTDFTVVDSGKSSIRIVMLNSNYPLDHFKGLFFEWMLFWRLASPEITAEETAGRHEYNLRWK